MTYHVATHKSCRQRITLHPPHPFLQAILCLVLAATLANPTFAISDALLEYYALNNIYYYNPTGNSSIFGSGGYCIGDNTNYSGAQIWTDAQLEVIQHNQSAYEEASTYTQETTGVYIPWQAIAVIHRREASLRMSNPSNGQGIYQLYSYTRIPGTSELDESKAFRGEVDEAEFLRQTKLATSIVMVEKARGLDLTTDAGLKQFFFNYNGNGGGRYKEKADAMYPGQNAPAYEGSPYVMNMYDADRDPTHPETMSPYWPGMFVSDGPGGWSDTATNNEPGTFVLYQALAGETGGGGICTGGLTEEQIREFMIDYYSQDCEAWGIYCAYSSTGGKMANCVTFVQYFLTRYNNRGLTITGTGNGADVVTNLINRNIGITGVNGTGGPSDTYGTVPRVFAVFGVHRGSSINPDTGLPYGHTGIVLGIDEAAGKIYIGQAGLNSSMNYSLTTIVQNLADYTDTDYMYAYTEGFLDTARIKSDFGF